MAPPNRTRADASSFRPNSDPPNPRLPADVIAADDHLHDTMLDRVPPGVRITSDHGVLGEVGDTRDAATCARLHLEAVGRVAGAGACIVGWLSDPLAQIASIDIQAGNRSPLNVQNIAPCFDATECHDLFRVPRTLSVAFGFIVYLSDPTDQAPLRLTIRSRGAPPMRCAIPGTGDVGQLVDLVASAPLAYGLAVVAHLLADFRADLLSAPPLFERLATIVYQRIDPVREYAIGRGAGRSEVECYVDTTIRVGTLGILVKGWLLKSDADRIQEMNLVSISGLRATVQTPPPAVARPDVIRAKAGEVASQNRDCGFVTFTAIPGLDIDDQRWFIELTMQSGAMRRVPFICGPEPVPLRGIETVVSLAEANALDLSDLFGRAIGPPLDWFWSKAHRDRPNPTQLVYGEPPAQPRISVIVPLYGRIDFVRHQIANFSNDPDFRAFGGLVELIYVLDDPDAERELKRLCALLFEIYGIPFRVLLLNGNFGYSAANNAGARIATGKLLLLLNSDVIPKRSRWLGQLARLYDTLDNCGILGCRLLFEDESIQHAGMTFRPLAIVAGAWGNDHRGKGLSIAFDPHVGATAVAAVTGACLLIDRAQFAQVGGLSEDYVIGDFEDSDLCLKIHALGQKIYYTPDVELYHLERQSMQLIARGHQGWRQSLTLFNMWKHGQRWRALIPVVMDRYDGVPAATPDVPVVVEVPAMKPARRKAGGRAPPQAPAL